MLYYKYSIGRPRKLPAERLSRYVQARVSDPHWNWLEHKAVEEFDGDVSKALRWCIDQSVILAEILDADEPRSALDELLHQAAHSSERAS